MWCTASSCLASPANRLLWKSSLDGQPLKLKIRKPKLHTVSTTYFGTVDSSRRINRSGCGNNSPITSSCLAVSNANLCSLNVSRFISKWTEWMGSSGTISLAVCNFILISFEVTCCTTPYVRRVLVGFSIQILSPARRNSGRPSACGSCWLITFYELTGCSQR